MTIDQMIYMLIFCFYLKRCCNASAVNRESTMFSPNALKIIYGMTNYQMSSGDFKNFLLDQHGKRKGRVSGLLSSDESENGLRQQLLDLKDRLNQSHKEYKAERKKDAELERTILHLVICILGPERPLYRKEFPTEDSEMFSSKALENIHKIAASQKSLLDPEGMKDLLKAVHGSKKPTNLPMLRGITEYSLKKVIIQFLELHILIINDHADYKHENRKDKSLIRRINNWTGCGERNVDESLVGEPTENEPTENEPIVNVMNE